MSVKLYQFYCDSCNWKKITDGTDEETKKFYQYDLSSTQGYIPKYDKKNQEKIDGTEKKRIKHFRCPKCGHVVKPKKIKDVYGEDKKKNEGKNDEKNWFNAY